MKSKTDPNAAIEACCSFAPSGLAGKRLCLGISSRIHRSVFQACPDEEITRNAAKIRRAGERVKSKARHTTPKLIHGQRKRLPTR